MTINKKISRRMVLSIMMALPSIHGFSTLPYIQSKQKHNLFPLYSAPASDQDMEELAAKELQRTAAHLQKLRNLNTLPSSVVQQDMDEETLMIYKQLLQKPASLLKGECKELKLLQKGRKPDLAARLAHYYKNQSDEDGDDELDGGLDDIELPSNLQQQQQEEKEGENQPPKSASFAGLQNLSPTATSALHRASFLSTPTPIQSAAIPHLSSGKSAILHASTGSGKTLSYLLPITEYLWSHQDQDDVDEDEPNMAIILTPTRELAAQVSGVAKVLSPPNTVRFISRPCNLLKSPKGREKGEVEGYGGIVDDVKRSGETRILVGSAKCIYACLFGEDKKKKKGKSAPMSKMEGKYLLSHVKWLVMDEVDRLLHVKKSRMDKMNKRKHEKPAAIITSAITRLTLGSTQIIAASATVGRPLRRELARVLGLPSQECPPVLRGGGSITGVDTDDEDGYDENNQMNSAAATTGGGGGTGRAVTIPPTVRHYVLPTDGCTSGAILTSAALIVRSMTNKQKSRKILVVLSKNCGMTIHNTLGVLRHFGCNSPEPKSLLDVLEADGTDRLIEVHRRVTGATGVGESSSSSSLPQKNDDAADSGIESGEDSSEEGYVLVCSEDSVRGLHLDGLDYVIVVGRPRGPDEYTHIAGRTGRAGRTGTVVNVVSFEQAAALTSWEKMLDVDFIPLDEEEVMEDEF